MTGLLNEALTGSQDKTTESVSVTSWTGQPDVALMAGWPDSWLWSFVTSPVSVTSASPLAAVCVPCSMLSVSLSDMAVLKWSWKQGLKEFIERQGSVALLLFSLSLFLGGISCSDEASSLLSLSLIQVPNWMPMAWKKAIHNS